MKQLKNIYQFVHTEALKHNNTKNNTPISNFSVYGDNVWNLYENSNERKFLYSEYNYIIDFSKYSLSSSLIKDIKVFSFNLLFRPDIFLNSNKKSIKRNRKHKSGVQKTKVLMMIINHINEVQIKKYGFTTLNLLSDLTIEMLQDMFSTIKFKNTKLLKTTLLFLCNSLVQKELPGGQLQFTENDIHQLRFKKPEYNYNADKTIPDELFALISENSASYVTDFLKLIGENTFDNNKYTNNLKSKYPKFSELFEHYKNICNAWHKDDMQLYSKLSYLFKKYGISLNEFRKLLLQIQSAAQIIILQYTGMRISEALSIKVGSVFSKDGNDFIKGTLTKNRPDELPVDDETWLIIPIVKDAVKVLEIFASINNRVYLFSSFELRSENSLRTISLNRRIKTFIKSIDNDNKWNDDIPSPHQFRHSFIQMLQRAKVGLPFISLYVKHTFTELSYTPNITTSGYGSYMKNLFNEVSPINHRHSIISDLINNDIAGKGKEKYTQKTEAFFEGQALSGKKLERYLKGLENENIVPILTGIGLCIRDWGAKDLNDNPPCLKTMQCSQTCSNNIVIKSILPTLKGRLKALDDKLNDPEYIYLLNTLKSQRDSLFEAIKTLEDQNNDT